MSDTPTIRMAFNSHGLGDVVHCCHAMKLYQSRGYDVAIQVEPNKRWAWEAAGIPIYDGPKQLPLHPYYYPDDFFNLAKPDHIQNKIAHLFEVAELPKLGTKEEVWKMVCEERIDAAPFVPGYIAMDVDIFLRDLPRPIILFHSKGTNWQEKKSIPDATAFAFINEMLASFDGSIVVLDWDHRAPMLSHPRVLSIYPRWDHMSLEHFGAMCRLSDLFIGVDSGPFHLAGWFDIPTLYVSREIPPVRCCLPSPNATYLVPAKDHEHWAARGPEWKFAEFRGPEATVQDMVITAISILEPDAVEVVTMQDIQASQIPGKYIYRRVGFDERPMELLSDGKIGEGAAGCERGWRIEQTPVGPVIMFYGDHGGPTCHLKLDDDQTLRGRWHHAERMPIELIPVATATHRSSPRVATARQPSYVPQAATTSGFVVGIPTLNRFDLLAGCIDAILTGSVVPDAIYVLDNSGGKWEGHSSAIVKTIVPPYNLGCSRSYNLLLNLSQPVPMIIMSDDIVIGHNTLEKMLGCPSGYVVADQSRAMMAFLIRPEVWSGLGQFDEVFWPIYHDDNDYFRRAELASVPISCPSSDGFFDNGPSATKQVLSKSEEREWDRLFDFCRLYYLDKWGGLPYQESYREPFGGDITKRSIALAKIDSEIASVIARGKGVRS